MMATRLRAELKGFRGEAALYRLDDGTYVVSSSVIAPDGIPETLVFGASDDGAVTVWSPVGGRRQLLDCDQAVREMGYEVTYE